MYFNEKNDTNIDKEFTNNKKINKKNNNNNLFLNKYKLIIIISLIVIISIIILVLLLSNRKIEYKLELSGEEYVTIYENSDYIEPGYNASSNKDDNLNSEVEIVSNLDNTTPGEYTITYTIGDVTKTRYVTVIEKPESHTYIYLKKVNGSETVYLKIGEEYVDPGYIVFSSTGKDLNNKVEVTGKVDVNKKGTYKIEYTLVDENGVTVTETRTVIVMDSEISLSLSTDKYTNKDIDINIKVIDNYFDYMILPNGNKITSSTYSYKVSSNGTYKFTVYSKKGNKKENSIEVKNIDKETPTGSCSGSYKNNVSTINVSAKDNIGIDKYVINNKSYTSNKITINSEIKSVNVTIYDKAGNSRNISCSLTNNNPQFAVQIKPTGSENIIHNDDTETLKLWMEKVNRNNRTDFYVTHIWAKDPYNQFKSNVSDNYGKELKKSKVLFQEAIQKNNLQNKLAVAVNASGFVLNGVWGQSYYDINSKYNKTATCPLVISNGKVIRDISGEPMPDSISVVYGLKKNGQLAYYKYPAGNKAAENIAVSQKIKDDGVLNTFTFKPVLVLDGKFVGYTATKNIRQGFCQIDKNNFVFITDIYESDSSTRTGFDLKELGNYMISLGCKTGFNLDGGGSTSLVYKKKNGNPTNITNPGREITDIIYFHE